MATQGIKVIDLPTIENIPEQDMDNSYFLITNPSFSTKIKASSLYKTFSGANSFVNLGGGNNVCDNVSNQTLFFNTISGNTPIKTQLVNNRIQITIENNSIESQHLKDNSISGAKFQNNSITPNKIAGFGSGLASSIVKTDIQTIPFNTSAFISNLSVTVTTTSVTSKVLLQGYLSISCPQGIMNIYRNHQGLTGDGTIVSPLPQTIPAVYNKKGKLISPVYNYGMFDIGNGDLNNAITVPISFMDTPNFAGQITYSLWIKAVGGTNKRPNDAYINRSYREDTRSTSHLSALVIP